MEGEDGEIRGGGSCDNHYHHQYHLLLMSEDVLIQILLWLPVISLLRFKSVCKSWRSIIESPSFINLHHSTTPLPSSSSSSKLGGSSLLFQGYKEEKKGRICTLSGEEFEVFGDLVIPTFDSVFDVFEEFEVLKEYEERVAFYMVSCCNGIICLHESSTRNVALWNPAIRKSRLLPKPSNLLGYPKWFDKSYITNDVDDDDRHSIDDIVRFGIDIKTSDHKVLLITTYLPKSKDYERRVHVYSLNADSWKCIEAGPLSTYPYYLDIINTMLHQNGLHLNGRLQDDEVSVPVPVLDLARKLLICDISVAIQICLQIMALYHRKPFLHQLHQSTTSRTSSSSSSKLGGSSLLFQGYEEKEGHICTLSGEDFEVLGDLVIPPLDSVFDVFEELEVLKVFKEWVRFYIVGCCNGIICLHERFTRNVALWNPAIKQSRLLPKPSNLLGYPKCFDKAYINDDDGYSINDIVRLGIDIKTNDHKVLLITTFQPKLNDYKPDPDVFVPYGSDHPDDYDQSSESSDDEVKRLKSRVPPAHRVHIYSLNTDSWRCIEAASSTLSAYPHLDIDTNHSGLHGNGLHLNGRYFFTAQYLEEYFMYLILSFDFTEEIFRTMQPPYHQRSKYPFNYQMYFIPFGEKIALVDPKIEYTEEHYHTYEYDVWVLNEQHGVKESWTKFYTIGPSTRAFTLPLCITNNGEFAIIYWDWLEDPLQDAQKLLQLLNLVTGNKKFLRCDWKDLTKDNLHVYKPSLVPTGGKWCST